MQVKTQQRFTAMSAAFYQASIANPKSRVCSRIGRSIERNCGLVNEREVDAKVSFKTAAQLKKQGVL